MLIELYGYVYSSANQSGKYIRAGAVNSTRGLLFNQTEFNLNIVFCNMHLPSDYIALSFMGLVAADYFNKILNKLFKI